MSDDTATWSAARRYIERGWSVIALYGVGADSRCMCGRPDCRSQGKHPIGSDWAARVINDPSSIPGGANIGLKTGIESGVFALDVDPKHGGDVRLAELEAEHGLLPNTWQQVTGSGGRHYVFSLPDDFTPTNSRGRLPVGLDIRGEGGQIVLAPSVSAVGPYVTLEGAQTVQAALPAPAWLLDLIRPLPPITVPVGMESAFTPPTPTGRGQAYAGHAVAELLEQLRNAVPGDRNNTAFRVACRLIELANAPWSGVTEVAAAQGYAKAGQSVTDAEFPEAELWQCWRAAARRIREQAAVLPPPPGGIPAFHEWGELGGPAVMPDFYGGGSPDGTAGRAPATGTPAAVPEPVYAAAAAAVGFDPFADAGVAAKAPYPQAVHNPVDIPAMPPGHVPHLRDFLLRRSELSRLPRPVPLIQGTLWLDTDAWLIGKSGSGKSFVALDWAAHIASGREWNNRRVRHGPVIWVVAEGASGIQQRVDAWEVAYGPIGDELIILPVAVQAALRSGRALSLSPQWQQLMEVGAEIRPVMMVLDTQARMTRGMNENDSDEMGQWCEAVSMLRRASGGPCNLVVHHIGRNGSDARGSSAIDGAQDVEWRVERTGAEADRRGRIVLDKNKDGEAGTAHPFAMKTHQLGWDAEAEEYASSLTISYDPFDQPGAAEPEHRTEGAQVRTQILEVLREGSLASGATKAEIRRKVLALRASQGLPKVGERTIDYALDSSGTDRAPGLLQSELVVQIGQRFADRQRYEQL